MPGSRGRQVRGGTYLDKRYELFCLADPLFYDSPSASQAAQRSFAAGLPPARCRPPPAGWTRRDLGDWLVHIPPGDPVPAQGWKIHVSAAKDNAERMLGKLVDYCVPRQVAFKFLAARWRCTCGTPSTPRAGL